MSIENHHDALLTAKIITAIGTADLLGVTDKTIAARVNTNLVRIRAHLTAMVLAGLGSLFGWLGGRWGLRRRPT